MNQAVELLERDVADAEKVVIQNLLSQLRH